MNSDMPPDAARRAVVTGLCGAAGAAVFAACGSQRGSDAGQGAGPVPGPASPTAAGGTRPALAATSDIPVGGGRVFPEDLVVVTQPAVGDLRAFDAICTHDGCMLTTVSGATIGCPCHGSRFAITDGTVVSGPAKRALTPRPIIVQDGSVSLMP